MIQIDNIRFQYQQSSFALQVDDLQISKGEKVAIVGPSGSGKTTLLDLIAGIQVPNRGKILIDNVDQVGLSERARRKLRTTEIGLVFQEFELLEYLTVIDNILLPYRICSDLKLDVDSRSRVKALADDVGIGDKLKRKPTRLSQGERQRVAICRALIHQPSVLLADEPTGNLDPANKEKIINLLIDQAAKSDATLLVVTHDHSLTSRFDRTIDVSDFSVVKSEASVAQAGGSS